MGKRVGFNDRQSVSPEVARPKDLLFQPSTDSEEEELIRVTYYGNQILKRALDSWALKLGKNKSVLFREIMTNAIPKEIQEEAEQWLKENGKI